MSKVLVTGHREGVRWLDVRKFLLTEIKPDDVLVHGDARQGVDRWVREFAEQKSIAQEIYPVQAGPTPFWVRAHQRNIRMLIASRPDRVVAFLNKPGMSGTRHMVEFALSRGYAVYYPALNR